MIPAFCLLKNSGVFTYDLFQVSKETFEWVRLHTIRLIPGDIFVGRDSYRDIKFHELHMDLNCSPISSMEVDELSNSDTYIFGEKPTMAESTLLSERA